jgi:hypothetical protein
VPIYKYNIYNGIWPRNSDIFHFTIFLIGKVYYVMDLVFFWLNLSCFCTHMEKRLQKEK